MITDRISVIRGTLHAITFSDGDQSLFNGASHVAELKTWWSRMVDKSLLIVIRLSELSYSV